MYIPPSQSELIYEQLFEYLEQTLVPSEATVIAGDFNISELQSYYVSNKMSLLCSSFINFLNYNSLHQQNQILNVNGRILDVINVSNDISCVVSSSEYPLVLEDRQHPSLVVELSWSIDSSKKFGSHIETNVRYNFRKANYQELYGALCLMDWNDLEQIKDVDRATDFFYNRLYTLLDYYVPKCPISYSHYPIWFTKDIRFYIKKKKKKR